MDIRSTLRSTSSVLAALLAITVVGCTESTGPVEESVDQILFVSTRGGASHERTAPTDIFRIDADGTGLVNLTRNAGAYGELAITPDGRTVVFDAWLQGMECSHVWSMAPDGSRLTDLTPNGCGTAPKLSPDGTRIAYEWEQRVFVVAIAGTGRREVSTELPPPATSCTADRPQVTVTPVGWLSNSRLLFSRFVCLAGTTSYAVNADGTGLTALDIWTHTAHVSPDGSRIAFDREWPGQPGSLRLMNADGSNVRTLVESGVLPDRWGGERSAWSPDGTRIFFGASSGYQVITVDGAKLTLLTPLHGWFNGWSPRGDRIMITRPYTDNRTDIFLLNADGSREVNLTGSPAWYWSPLWIPRR